MRILGKITCIGKLVEQINYACLGEVCKRSDLGNTIGKKKKKTVEVLGLIKFGVGKVP